MKRIDRFLARLREKELTFKLSIDQQKGEEQYFVMKHGQPDPDYSGVYFTRLILPSGMWISLGEGRDAREALETAGKNHGDILARDHPELYIDGIRCEYYQDGETWKFKD